MSVVITGLLTSILAVTLCVTLFVYEDKKGRRIGEEVRTRLDFAVLTTAHTLRVFSRRVGYGVLRQVVHYLFHAALRGVLTVVSFCGNCVERIMRVNRTLAKNAERESMVRSKLEEIALHKAQHALSEEEKRRHRDTMLEGF